MSATASSAPLPKLPLCNFDYVLEVYRLLPDQSRARVPLRESLPFLPPPLPDLETLGGYTESPSPFGYAEAGQTFVGYMLLAFLLTSERRQRQHHRANGGRKRRRLMQHRLDPWHHEAGFLRWLGRLSLRLTFAHDLALAIKLGLAARRAKRGGNTDLEERCHQAFASALSRLYAIMQELSNRNGGGVVDA